MRHNLPEDFEEERSAGLRKGGMVVKLAKEMNVPLSLADMALSELGWNYLQAKEAIEKRVSRPMRPDDPWPYDRSVKLSFDN